MFRNLFGKYSADSNNLSAKFSDADRLLKQATEQKRHGEIDAAIQSLKLAYQQIEQGSIVYGVDTFLRLPLYLQAAGRNDEAWSEFNRLISKGYPNQLKNFGVQAMEHSKIYDKMRLFLQRENKNDRAIQFGVLSELSWIRGLYLQNRTSELEQAVSENAIHKKIKPLLKKAKRLELIDRLVRVILEEVHNPANNDLIRAAKRVGELIFEFRSSETQCP
jgi:hypothetical protein